LLQSLSAGSVVVALVIMTVLVAQLQSGSYVSGELGLLTTLALSWSTLALLATWLYQDITDLLDRIFLDLQPQWRLRAYGMFRNVALLCGTSITLVTVSLVGVTYWYGSSAKFFADLLVVPTVLQLM